GEALFRETEETESIFSDLNGKVFLAGENCVCKIVGRFGDAQLWFNGEADLAKLFPKRKGPRKTPFFKRPDFPRKYALLVEKLENSKSSLRNCPRAFVAARLRKAVKGHVLSLDGQASKGDSERIAFERVMAHVGLRQQGEQWRVEGIPEVLVQEARLRERGSLTEAKLRVTSVNSTTKHFLGKIGAHLQIEGLRIDGRYDGTLKRVYAEIEIEELDRIKATCTMQSDRLHLALEGKYQFSASSGSIQGRGNLFPTDFQSDRFRELDRANILRAPDGISLLMANASLGPGMSVTKARMRATARNLTCRGVQTKRTSVTVRYLKGGDWLLDPLLVEMKDSRAKGSYSRKPTRDYRFLLKGIVQPEEINPWMGNWWGRLWRDFQIVGSPPMGDFDVAGRWQDPSGHRRHLFGSIRFGALSYRNLPVETGSVIILADSNQTIARDLALNLERGWAKGFLSWENNSEGNGSAVTRYSLQGEVAPSDCLDVFGSGTRETLVKFKSEKPIKITAMGVTRDEENESELYLDANASNPLRYANVPLETLSFELHQKGGKTNINDLNFQFAGGLAKGTLEHSEVNGNPNLAIELELKGAERIRAVEALRLSNIFGTEEDENGTQQDRERIVPQTDRGILDFTLSAVGNPNDSLSFRGNGKIDLRDSNLGSIRLFGPLSKTLSSSPIPLPSGSVNFTRLISTYDLNGTRATFDELTIVSSTALIRGKGEWSLEDNMIDFNARMYLLGGFSSKIPIIGKIADFADPLSKFLQLELRGSLDDPKWGLTVNPTLLFDK
ncbi:MAG: hypothetical protein AAEJ57_04735, partial [Opitutales bacterium]